MSDRGVLAKPDSDGDLVEAIAWWDPGQLRGNPAVRPELLDSLDAVLDALDATPEQPVEKAAGRRRWITDGVNACDVCAGNAAAGLVAALKPFPSGHTAPPAHPHCGCRLDVEGGSHG